MVVSSTTVKGKAVNSLIEHTNTPSPTFASFYDALDISQKKIISHGLDVQAEFNTVCAVEYLKAHDIDGAVIQQVLSPRA
jgi:hypothetical protein